MKHFTSVGSVAIICVALCHGTVAIAQALAHALRAPSDGSWRGGFPFHPFGRICPAKGVTLRFELRHDISTCVQQ